jgi:cyclic pyranopterin phosphate synthase
MSDDLLDRLRKKTLPKGDPFEVARIAGILAAKKTSDLIPLCHPLPLTQVDVSIDLTDSGARVETSARTLAETGVEMEALVAASLAALTIYDMCKAVDKGVVIGPVRLLEKTGGKSGTWQREGLL